MTEKIHADLDAAARLAEAALIQMVKTGENCLVIKKVRLGRGEAPEGFSSWEKYDKWAINQKPKSKKYNYHGT